MDLISKQLEKIVNEKIEAEARRLNTSQHEAETEKFQKQLIYIQNKLKAVKTYFDENFNNIISRNEVEGMQTTCGEVPLLQEVNERPGKRTAEAMFLDEDVGLYCDLNIEKKIKF
jgi:hypothetical protein